MTFPSATSSFIERHGIDLEGLQILPGKTFHWSGEYEANMNNRRTLLTELGVFETFTPTLPEAYQDHAVRAAGQHRARRCSIMCSTRCGGPNSSWPTRWTCGSTSRCRTC